MNNKEVVEQTEVKGDLISREYLQSLAYSIEDKYCDEKKVVDLSDIDNAPTIIEGDKGPEIVPESFERGL